MPTYFQRPENALNRAKEFIGVGKKQRALDALYDVIKSKKHRTWQKTHEQIMEKYLELCVELRKSHVAKEGLYQYKNICQQVNIQSLVEVVRKYVALAEEKTEAARQESHQVVVDIDDLDVPDTPESLLLKAVSGEDTQDRTDRAILTPWVKFLWESYRQCLDLLRNNSRVERLYQDIAQQAFYFCLKYGRKTEFRKLCDNLRTHLGHVNKHQHQQTAINLNNAESQQMHLETRLVQLDSAINMELWQEAFKAVEDIHGLISLSKKSPKPSLMANYYQKLSLVFCKSGNHLFHACTLHRLFHLSREQKKNISQEELQRMASKVLCATLAVPIPPARNSIDALLEQEESAAEKQRCLATLLMLQSPPTRKGMIKDLVKFNLIQYVHPDIQNLYRCLEVDFHPLRLFSRIASSMEFISKRDDLNQYESALEDIIITRVLKQVSQVYQSISFSGFCSLVPFASPFHLERVIVDAAKTLELQVRVDHRTKSLSFGTDLGLAQKEDVPEGPYIQNMPSEQIRNQLLGIAEALHKAVEILNPKEQLVSNEELKAQIFNSYKMSAKKEHYRILQRRHIIEDRKEQLELMNEEREREEMTQQEEQRKKAYDAEMARLEREAKERERQRQLEEHKEIQRKHARERIEQLKKTDLGAKVLQNIDEEDFAELDIDDIMQKQVEQLEKEKKELHEKLKSQEKKIDHFVRAKRQEEIPLLQKQYEEERVKLRELFEQQENERIENMKSEREFALKTKERLMRIMEDKDKFLQQLQSERKSDYTDKLKAFEIHLSKEREKRLLERKERRKEERRRRWIKEKEELAQQKIDEALLREREEKERLEQEEREKEESEMRERMRKLDEQAAKQREREREIEEREMKRREEERMKDRRADDSYDRQRRPVDTTDRWRSDERDGSAEKGSPWSRSETSASPEKKVWRPPGSEGGGWRARERERDERWKRPESGGDRWSREPPQDGPDGADRWSRGPDRERFQDSPREQPKDGYRARGFDDREDFRERAPRDDNREQQRGPREDFRDRAPRDDFRGERGPRDNYPDRERGVRDMDERGQRSDFRDRERGPRDDFRDRERGPRDDHRDRERGPRDEYRERRDDMPDRGSGREEGSWRRGGGPDSHEDFDRRPRFQREERDGPGPDRGAWGRRGEDRDRGGGSEWRRGGDDRSERRLPERSAGGFERDWRRGEDRDRERGEPPRGDGGSAWRRGGPQGQSPADNRDGRPTWKDKSAREEENKPRNEEGDGWTTVRY